MRKILTILMLLALAVPMWAGEQTITISRNDGQYNSAEGVYYAKKGGVTMKMSGGLNNKNYLVLRHTNTVSFESANFPIKKIIFHCLDNFTSSNLDVFYWGPTTMNVMPVELYGTETSVVPGKFTASGYDGTWVSSFSGTWTSVFRNTDATGDETRTHTSYDNGWPVGNSLIFGSRGKPIRFSSIDIVIEKESGDIYDLVTSDSEIQENQTYVLVSQYASKALGTGEVNGPSADPTKTIASTPVTFPVADKSKVRTTSDVQLITLEHPQWYESRPWLLKVGGNYIKRRNGADHRSNDSDNRGWNLQKVSANNLPTTESDMNWYYFRVSISVSGNTNNNALIKFYHTSSEEKDNGDDKSYNYAIRHRNGDGCFRDIDYSSNNQYAANQRVYLYKPAQNYKVYTEVMPNDGYGTISLRDGIIVANGENTSQKFETVSFLVTPAEGKKISSITITKYGDASVVIPEDDIIATHTTGGTIYSFEMPGHDVQITATFEDVQYHNINIVIEPDKRCGDVFLTDGYVVQNDQVMSFEGENVIFNVTPNLIDINDESKGYYQLTSVTVTDDVTGETITYNLADGNYTFTMPNHAVTITATFNQEAPDALYLLGTANGGYWTNNGNWHAYGPVFNYNENIGYYLDVYFKGTGEYEPNGNTDNAYGYFSISQRYADNDDWSYLNGYRLVARQYDWENEDIADGVTKPLYADADNNRGSSFRIPAGIYRIVVNKNKTQVTVTKRNISLNFEPSGGATAEDAEIVSLGTEVALMGSLYNAIQYVNSNIITPQNTPLYIASHDDANFKYKTVKTIGDNVTIENPVASTTSINTTLDVLNEGETVTKLDGVNYLGWIVAENTGYYKVIDTPLSWIEEHGEEGKIYTVSDQLQGVYAQDGHLWCKDLGNQSIVETSPNTDAGQIDFLGTTLKTADHRFAENMRINDWDQSNWVELDFTGLGQSEAVNKAQALVNKYIKAGSVTGVYSDDVNYAITLTAEPSEDGAASYVPNTYCTANFLEGNLTAAGVTTGEGENAKNYYFLNPKVQEYAIVTFAMWDKTNQIMVIPDNTPFNGAVKFGRWDWNNPSGQLDMLNNDNTNPLNAYEFHVIVQRANKSYGTPATASGAPAIRATDSPSGKTDQTASTVIMAQPLDLEVEHPLPTGINGVVSDAKVVGVEYVNLAGVRSSKPFAGMNIVVTRYSDGTFSTTKVVK